MNSYVETKHFAFSRLPNGNVDVEQIVRMKADGGNTSLRRLDNKRVETIDSRQVAALRAFFNETPE